MDGRHGGHAGARLVARAVAAREEGKTVQVLVGAALTNVEAFEIEHVPDDGLIVLRVPGLYAGTRRQLVIREDELRGFRSHDQGS